MRIGLNSKPRTAIFNKSLNSIMRLVVFILCLITVSSTPVSAQRAEEPISISIISVIANPDKYNGKMIRVVGYVCIEQEGTAVYLHKEDMANSIRKNAFALHFENKDMKNSKKIDGRYALIEGVFDSNTGHMGLFSGSIHSVQRISPMMPIRQ